MAERRSPTEETNVRSAARPDWGTLALLLLALIAAAPLWTGPGLVNTRAGGDSPFLFIRLHQLVENLRAGVFPARWMPDAAYGLGYPFFNFYAALPYYFAAIFNLLGFDLLASIKIVQSLGFVFAAWAMYGWVKSTLGSAPAPFAPLRGSSTGASYARHIAWLAAVAYTFAPFHLVNVYVRGDSLSEFYAFVFYPLILWAIDRVVAEPRPRSIALLGLAYGGLILTHNVSALIFSPFVLLHVVFRSWRLEVGGWRLEVGSWRAGIRRSAFTVLHSALGIGLGLLLSAWFWLPALGEAPLVQLDAQTTGYFNYANHFRAADLIQPSLAFDYSTAPPRTPFAMGLMQAMAALAGAVALIATGRGGSGGLRLFSLIGLLVSTLMITPFSKPLWDALPLLSLAQFPWRFLSVQALFASLAIGHLAIVLRGEAGGAYSVLRSPCADTQYAIRNTKLATWLAAVLGIMLAASALLPLRPDYLPIRAGEITPAHIQLYEAFTTNIGTTIRAEYLPRTTIPRPYTGPALIDPGAPPRAIPVRGEAQAEQIERGPASQTWTIRAANDATLALPTLYFPGWKAAIDGQALEARAAADLGYIEIDVPAGEHTLTLWLDRTPIRAAAEIVSLLAALGAAAMVCKQNMSAAPSTTQRAHSERSAAQREHCTACVEERARCSPERSRRVRVRLARYFLHLFSSSISARRYEIAVLAVAAALAGVASLAHAVPARDDDLSMDFESKPWLHHPDDGGIRRYEISPLAPGSPLSVSFEWFGSDAPGQTISAQLVAPSRHAFGGPEAIASSEGAPLRAGVNRHTLQLPASLSPGMYYVTLEGRRVEGLPATVFLKPLFYAGMPVEPGAIWAHIGGQIELKAVALKHDQPDGLSVAFDWAALKPIAANYAVSLRLHDAAGRIWVSLDTQPGYGFLPTSAWQPGVLQRDRYTLALPADLPRDAAYALDVVWYRVASQQEIGRVRLPGISFTSTYDWIEILPPPRVFDVPPMQQRVDATFGGVIRLLGYDLRQDKNRLALTLRWQALADVGADYKFFVHVFDPATEHIAAQIDAMPAGNAYPTARWLAGEVVSESVELTLEAGTYRLATGWYDPISRDRLPAFSAGGDPLAGNRLILGADIRVP